MNKVLNKIVIIIILSFLILISCVNFGIKNTEFRNNILMLEFDIETLRRKSNMLNKEIDNSIVENELANSIVTSANRSNFEMLVEVIAKEYNFLSFNAAVSDSELVDIKKNAFFDVMFTTISLNFKTESEVKVYTFIDELMDKIPGYVVIKSLKTLNSNNFIFISVELSSYTLVLH